MAEIQWDELPGVLDIDLYQGDYWERSFTVLGSDNPDDLNPVYTAIDLTGFTGEAMVRVKQESAEVLASFEVEVTDPVAGIVTVRMQPTEAAKLTSSGFWDLQLVSPGGRPHTFLRGRASVTKDVSRA